MKTLKIIIKGRVQDVYFRKYTQISAKKLLLTGFVLNADSGNVEVEVTGDENTLKEFTEWCHKGSPLSKVQEVIITELPLTKYSDFNIRY